ncbi:unnamed protein product [Somion occarium]|uniref:Uncharacterized protein n=1 Tax=Somion occarium TaxID=3059160 RepID=A0ABP1DG29_9APHY
MSTRQNKKRKGRNNVLNRERTVTTLTEGPEGTFLIPTPTDEPAPSANIMSTPFSVASSAAATAGGLPPNFAMTGGFGPFSNYHQHYMPGPMAGPPFQQQQPPQFFQQPPSGPPGQSDLELLERLKETIKNNQHEIFRPVPQPDALASVYLGPRPAVSQVPPHPEQIPMAHEYASMSDSAAGVSSGNNGVGATSAIAGDARRLRAQGSDSWDNARKAGPDSGVTPQVSTTNNTGSQRYDLSSGMSSAVSKPDNLEADTTGPPGLNTQPSSPTAVQRQRSQPEAQYAHGNLDKITLGESVEVKKEEIPPRLRDSTWNQRPGSLDDMKSSFNDHVRNGNRPEARYNDNNRSRFYDRERDRDRDRDINWDRDRDRVGPGIRVNNRDIDRDRRNDDRFRPDNRRPTADQRHYEPRYPQGQEGGLRRYDTKSSISSAPELPATANAAPASRVEDTRERDRVGPPVDTRVPRPLGEERSSGSLRLAEDRDRRPPPPLDDRRPPPDDRRPPPEDRRPAFDDRRPQDDRRGPPPPLDRERSSRALDDRRPPPPAAVDRRLPLDDHDRRRSPGPGGPGYNNDRPVRPLPLDDRRPPRAGSPPPPPPALSTGDRGPPDDRRPPPASRPIDRTRQVAAPPARGPPPAAEDRRQLPPAPPPASTVVDRDRQGRPPVDDRSDRDHPIARPPPHVEDRDRNERLGGRPEQTPTSRTEAAPITSSEPRLPVAPESTLRPADARGEAHTEASRPPPAISTAEDRGRPIMSDRFARGGAPPAGDRERTRTGPIPSHTGRAPSVVRDDRTFKPRLPTVSPSRRNEYRPGYRPPADYDRDRRPDSSVMDVGNPPRYGANDRPYRRPSPTAYDRSDRSWVPAADAFPADSARRPPPDSHPFSREWREDERSFSQDWDRWRDPDRERDREFDRDSRFVERDALPPAAPPATWDRDRRISYPPAADAPAAPARPFEPRPLSARLSDTYPPDDRDRVIDRDRPFARDFERGRYPADEPPAAFNRVRPRSPSPAGSLRRHTDDLRPPMKRVRDDAYSAGYYSPPSAVMDVSSDYSHSHVPARLRTPPPAAGYYDESRGGGYNVTSAARGVSRERDFADARDAYAYDRRDARMPPPPPPRRSPPPYGRAYDRDDRRYIPPPPRP